MRTFADLLSARVSQSPDATAYRFPVTGDVAAEGGVWRATLGRIRCVIRIELSGPSYQDLTVQFSLALPLQV
jgi:hypothetical protein